MISDLLDLSKIEAGNLVLHRKETDVAQMVENVALTFSPLANEHGLELTAEITSRPIFATVDEDKLVEVLTNLTNNAFKFTKAGTYYLVVGRNAESNSVRG